MDSTTTASVIRKNEAEFCGKVPLHQTNQIQPHGVVIVVQQEGLKILQASENVETFLGITASDLINTSLQQYLSPLELDRLEQQLAHTKGEKVPLVFSFNGIEVLCLFQLLDKYFLMELEAVRNENHQNSFVHVYQEVKQVMAALESVRTTQGALSIVARELKRISGFDKIMIYQFDEDWNGEVIAEEKEEDMDAYLGLKFPASDIPRQARELYRTTPYRLIPNVYYEPVKLYPVINPLTFGFTDLTNCSLRSVAGVHVEYLKNMGVTASMSTRILKDGELWGLIACHHRTPKYLSYQVASMFEMLSTMVTSKLTAVQYQDAYKVRTEQQRQLNQIMEVVYRKNDLVSSFLSQHQELLALLQADGIALHFNNQVEAFGKTPNKQELEDLIYWLQSRQVYKTFHQPCLSEVFENASTYAEQCSGLLALPLQPDKGYYLMAFRSEAIQKISWGGNPNEAVQLEKDKKTYHPRNSFAMWQETVYNKSQPWSPAQLESAENLRSYVIEYILNKA